MQDCKWTPIAPMINNTQSSIKRSVQITVQSWGKLLTSTQVQTSTRINLSCQLRLSDISGIGQFEQKNFMLKSFSVVFIFLF